MSKKHTYEEVKESFEKEGYTLLSKEYISAFDKLDYICKNGHRYKIKWNSWQQGHRCPTCAVNNKKLTYKFMKESFEKENYILLSKEYTDRYTKLHCKCPKNHEYFVVWGNWIGGYRCPYCAGVGKPSFEQVKESFEKEGYTLLSKEYIKASEKLEYKVVLT